MQAKISTLFYIKRTKANNLGQVPIYLRVTVDGERFEMSSTKFVEPSKWSNDQSKVRGNSEEARLINSHLDSLKVKVFLAESFSSLLKISNSNKQTKNTRFLHNNPSFLMT